MNDKDLQADYRATCAREEAAYEIGEHTDWDRRCVRISVPGKVLSYHRAYRAFSGLLAKLRAIPVRCEYMVETNSFTMTLLSFAFDVVPMGCMAGTLHCSVMVDTDDTGKLTTWTAAIYEDEYRSDDPIATHTE